MDLSTAMNASAGAPAPSSGGTGNAIGTNNNMNGAVACPVCTLYLREGISLQNHLDTHPKEQVIEALIRASSSGAGPTTVLASQMCTPPQALTPQPVPTPQPMPPVTGTQSTSGSPSPHVPHPTQPPYPMGPIYECPPQINAMIPPPQFASFSYQQFVNNGTMMVPAQYAMAQAQAAPTSQMMQMLYSPYGMYHQQQIPTVQMISAPPPPAAMMSTTATTLTQPPPPVPAVAARVRSPIVPTTNNVVAANVNETVSVAMTTATTTSPLPQLPRLTICTPEPRSQEETRIPVVPMEHNQAEPMVIEEGVKEQCVERTVVNNDSSRPERIALTKVEVPGIEQIQREEDRRSDTHVEHTEQQTLHSTDRVEQSYDTDQYQREGTPTSISDLSKDVTDYDKTERILADTEMKDKVESFIVQESCEAENHKDSVTMEENESVESAENLVSEIVKNKEFIENNKCDEINIKEFASKTDDVLQSADEIMEPQNLSADESRMSIINKPELDQVNRFLGSVESELSNIDLSSKESKNAKKSVVEEQDVTFSDLLEKPTDEDETTNTSYHKHIGESIECKIIVAHEESDVSSVASSSIHCDMEIKKNTSSAYHYKYSRSAPTSPVSKKKFYRSLSRASLRSDFDRSNENICPYPVGFEATTLQDFLKDNYNDEDMEFEENEPQPHHSYRKQSSDIIERASSHTTLSTRISGVCTLKSSLSDDRAGSPVSVHSTSSYCQMEDDDEDEDDSDADSCQSNDKDDDDDEDEEDDEEHLLLEEASRRMMHSEIKRESEIMRSEVCKALMPNDSAHQQQLQQPADFRSQNLMAEHYSSSQFPINHHSTSHQHQHQSTAVVRNETYPLSNSGTSQNLLNLSECVDPTTSTDSKSFNSSSTKSSVQKTSTELLNISEDAHAGPINVFEFDGLQILVPSTFISESSQKAVSGTSQQSMASSENGTGNDEEVKSVNMRADETMPARGELSEQESNGCTEQSAWQLYMGQDASRMSTSYDLMARESWEESEGSEHEDNNSGPLLDSRSLATHFTSSLFLDRDRKTPTRHIFKCSHCPEVFECPKERRVHSTLVHKEAGPSSCSNDNMDQSELKEIKLLEGRANVFEDIFVPSGLHIAQQAYQMHHQQHSPLLHQLQPPQQRPSCTKTESDSKIADPLHLSTVSEVTCNMCNQRFSSEKSLQVHHRRVHIADTVKRIRESAKCQICNEEFNSVANFNLHLKIHPLECGQCGKYFYRKQNFKLHMKRHLGIKPFPCNHCDKAFLTKQKLDEHTNGHTGNAPVKCNLCNETFRRYSNLTQHKNRHHLNIKKKLKDYICHCGEVFHTKKKLAWHKETHDEKPKACTYCNERFIHMASLTRHMRRAHNRRFVPDAQRENENVECPICKCIYLRSSLAVHMRVHNGERPYECQVCSKAFSTKWNLQLHKWTHAARSTKPFKCNQCSAAFYRHSDYTAHMNSHRNVRPYTCNYCGAQFIRKYNCLRHVKEHEENKQYTCEICSKTFHRSYYLKEHLRVHSGQRPYTCHICGKSSSTKSNHNKHVRIHHAREPVNTEN
ncbi:uncharacterized protein LOC106639683 [Copidosoma floridanum]|uniref:uncharacterized protein LOC106639683 n=1 Tax=Copidosoma floridanum TaxID=29053 RepID=UPI0006C9BB6E|nr:uncharacterized protein LOC106639683 [Copidosoma floridanum]